MVKERYGGFESAVAITVRCRIGRLHPGKVLGRHNIAGWDLSTRNTVLRDWNQALLRDSIFVLLALIIIVLRAYSGKTTKLIETQAFRWLVWSSNVEHLWHVIQDGVQYLH
jgi:hypothetical protein